jgi:sugar phosphate isomerase/epimerase
VVSAIFPGENLEQIAQIAQQLRLDSVEAMCWPTDARDDRKYAGTTHIDVGDFTRQKADDVRALLGSHDVRLNSIGYYPNALSRDEEEARQARRHLRRCLKAASLLRVPLNTFVGRDPWDTEEQAWTAFKGFWPDFITEADDLGVEVAVENCPMRFTEDEYPGGKNLASTPAAWDRMFGMIPSNNWGLELDPSHWVWQHMNPAKFMPRYFNRVITAHAKDATFDKERAAEVGILAHPLEYHTPQLPGQGGVDWQGFLHILHAAGYDGDLSIEVEAPHVPPTAPLADRIEAVRVSAAFLRGQIDAFVPAV